jgi:hypothetical protein
LETPVVCLKNNYQQKRKKEIGKSTALAMQACACVFLAFVSFLFKYKLIKTD